MRKIKIKASELRPGMHVCELDRSWEETPFLIQGFPVKDVDDIREIIKYCNFVYIDPARTIVRNQPREEATKADFLLNDSSLFMEQDFRAAEAARKNTSSLIQSFMEKIRLGQTPGFELAKDAVSECMSRIIANPQAIMFLTRLREKDKKSVYHAFNICILSIVLGRLLGLDKRKQEQLGVCGLLHDMGIIKVPDSIMNKHGALTKEEEAILREHARDGRDILMSGNNLFSGVVDVAFGHHENLDGTGYPRGLTDQQISTFSRIVAVVDRYEDVLCPHINRPAADHLSALAFLKRQAKSNKIDGEITAQFIAYMGIFPPGGIVETSRGEIGIVLKTNPYQLLKPLVLIVRNADQTATNRIVDMAQAPVSTQGKPDRIVTVHPPGAFGIDLNKYFETIMQAFRR